MAKKKLKIKKPGSGKSWRDWFSWAKKRQPRGSEVARKEQMLRRIRIVGLSLFLPLLPAGLAVGFFYLEKYVRADHTIHPRYGSLVFADAPEWAYSQAMKSKLASAAGAAQFELNDTAAKIVAEQLEKLAWLYNIQVRTTTRSILVNAGYREPQALVKVGRKTCYVGLPDPADPLAGGDNVVFVLDYVEINKPPMIEIVGFTDENAPKAGQTWFASDVSAALHLIKALKAMDDKICPSKPLREQIATIDVSNYDGKKSSSLPHIVLNLKNGTPVRWGTAIGQSTRLLEAGEVEKLTKLYTLYQSSGMKFKEYSYIELRIPEGGIPKPQ